MGGNTQVGVCTQKGVDNGLVDPAIMPFVLILIILTTLLTPLLLKLLYKGDKSDLTPSLPKQDEATTEPTDDTQEADTCAAPSPEAAQAENV